MDFYDPYEDISIDNLIYTTENIPVNETEEQFYDIFTNGCKCQNICSFESNCLCINKYGINYKIQKNFKINNNRISIQTNYTLNTDKTNGVYECNSNCNCKNKVCGNKLIQFGPRNYLEIKNCHKKGYGLFTTEKIFKGNFICEYAGEILTQSVAIKRFEHNKKHNLMNYIIYINEHFGKQITTTIIDPTLFGNIGRFLNHSCNPNCILVPVRINLVIPKLSIFAKNDIEKDSELTFNYADGTNEDDYNKYETNLKECACGEDNCRKWLPFQKVF